MVTTENGVIKPKDEIQELSFVRADELDSMQARKAFFSRQKDSSGWVVYCCKSS